MVAEDALRELARLCDEAVRKHGGDWTAVEAQLRAGLASLSASELDQLDEVVRLLMPCGPVAEPRVSH